jgi:WD40 repeat protein
MSQSDLGLVNTVAFRRDGQQLASGSSGGLYLWDVASHQPIQPFLSEYLSDFTQVVYHPDQEYLASSAGDGTVILWNLRNFQVFAQFQVGRERANSVAFSSDGQTLASGICDRTEPGTSCAEGRIVVWKLDPSAWKELACETAGRNLSQQEWKIHFENRPYHVTCPQWPSRE